MMSRALVLYHGESLEHLVHGLPRWCYNDVVAGALVTLSLGRQPPYLEWECPV